MLLRSLQEAGRSNKSYLFTSAVTLLFLAAHDCEESGEGRHDDQRDCDGHGTDRPRPGGENCR